MLWKGIHQWRRLACLMRLSVAALAVGGLSVLSQSALAQRNRAAADAVGAADSPSGASCGPIAEYRSKHFLIHTDLPPDAASALQSRLEATLSVVAKYWGRPSRGQIECYVAKDLQAWPDDALPHPLARVLIGGVGGGTVVRTQRNGKRTVAKAEVYSSARPGIAEHEAVHAYCNQTFGATGPDWYKEGMADMAYYHRHGEHDLRLPAEVLASLKRVKPRTLNEIVNRGRFTGKLHDSVDTMLAKHESLVKMPDADKAIKHVPLEAWRPEHDEDVKTARESYLWSWALCHLLCENPNYADRFRALGLGYLTGQKATFEEAFGPVAREIGFEYEFFLAHLDNGYRVDLCSWEWNKQFLSAAQRPLTAVNIHSKRGYQASGLEVVAGQRYAYVATGSWALGEEKAVTADGDAAGRGRLVGVLLDQYKLSEPFELGCRGVFTAPAAGKLYLRCRDAWNSLADNHGAIAVRIALEGKSLETKPPVRASGK